MFADLLRRAASQFSARLAVRFGERNLTYAQLYDRSCRLTQVLAGAQLKPDDRVATLGANCLESLEEVTGLALAGMVRVPLYSHDSAERQVYMLECVQADGLIVDQDAW